MSEKLASSGVDTELPSLVHARGDAGTLSAGQRRWIWPASLLGLLALFLLGYLPLRAQRVALADKLRARERELPAVTWIKPKRAKLEPELTLPGNIQGLEETVLYARTDGYLARFLVDLGDRVSAGQLLAELDTPEASQELALAGETLAQAEAALARAHAKSEHSAANLRRYTALAAGLTSREALEQKAAEARLDEADVRVAEAARNAQRASLERLKLRQAFARVTAPFAGTITARMVERGSLVSAGRASPLFKLTSLERLRVFVQVPQARVADVRVGRPARVTVAEFAQQTFTGTVTRTADALDPSSRTMTAEIQVPNPERRLLPGMYGSVTLALGASEAAADRGLLSVPATALISGEHGVQVARVDAEQRVQLVPVVVERDRGLDIELASGLRGDEQIIVNPGPGLRQGSAVRASPARGP